MSRLSEQKFAVISQGIGSCGRLFNKRKGRSVAPLSGGWTGFNITITSSGCIQQTPDAACPTHCFSMLFWLSAATVALNSSWGLTWGERLNRSDWAKLLPAFWLPPDLSAPLGSRAALAFPSFRKAVLTYLKPRQHQKLDFCCAALLISMVINRFW